MIFFKSFSCSSSIQIHHFLRRVSFNDSSGAIISFDKSGELIGKFDIINWITFSNQTFLRVKIGRIDPQAPLDQLLSISEKNIVWPTQFGQVESMSFQQLFIFLLRIQRASVFQILESSSYIEISDCALFLFYTFSIHGQAQPLSLCNDKCHSGYRKTKKENKHFCCYDCILCSEGKISNQTGEKPCE